MLVLIVRSPTESSIGKQDSTLSFVVKKPERLNTLGPNVPAQTPESAVYSSMLGSVLSTSLGPSSSHGPQIFLRIRVTDTADAVHISTPV